MPKATWSGTISLGMFNIPAKMYVANREEKVRFATVEKATGERIRMPFVSSVTGEEVDRRNGTLKRYEFPDGRTVDVTADDIEMVRPQASKVMQLEGFVDSNAIHPSLFASTNQIGPGDGGAEGLSLLAYAMASTRTYALGRYVRNGHERLFVLTHRSIWDDERNDHDLQVFINELYWPDEVRESVTVPNSTSDQLKDMTVEMAKAMYIGFDHDEHQNTHKQALVEMLDAKAKGKTFVSPEVEQVDAPADIMAALEAQIAAAKAERAA